MNNAANIDHNIYNTHANDAQGFAFNGAARRIAFTKVKLSFERSEVDSRVPVRLVPGNQAPELVGERGGHFTKEGTRISHPGAYAKSGWSNMEYRTDSREVVVGAEWTPWS